MTDTKGRVGALCRQVTINRSTNLAERLHPALKFFLLGRLREPSQRSLATGAVSRLAGLKVEQKHDTARHSGRLES